MRGVMRFDRGLQGSERSWFAKSTHEGAWLTPGAFCSIVASRVTDSEVQESKKEWVETNEHPNGDLEH